MPASLTHDIMQGPPPPVDPGWGDGDGGSEGRGGSRRASFTGLYVLLAASTMVFAALTSALVVRRGLSDDWSSMAKPAILWLNTVVLLASSFALEVARRCLKAGARGKFNTWWTLGTGLGVLFLAGQWVAWQQLKSAGIYISSNPSSSFFYLLTASHAFHLLGGVTALIYVDVQALRLSLGPAKRTRVDISAIFWHFLDGLWLYLMLLFYVWG
ncbi:MAG TPA: heme-copper oxidase subunit III [Candidatus Acidoferrales bacterium]|nr:heme-copper oxidase subunit III [Candidatus Acidoferrales bacterium]